MLSVKALVEGVDVPSADAIAKYVFQRKGGGTVRVNEANHAMMIDDGEAVFLGVIDPEEFEYVEDETSIVDEVDDEKYDEHL